MKTTSIKNKGITPLTDEQEAMRMQVVDLELKARYWAAQFQIRDFTLKAEAIQAEYDAYLTDQKAKQEELMKQFQEQLQKVDELGENGDVIVTEVGGENVGG